MAKERSKKLSSTKTHVSDQKVAAPSQETVPELLPPEPVSLPNSIKIEVVSYENIKTTYPLSDLTIKFDFNGVTLFQSPKTQVLNFDVIDINFDFAVPCDLSNLKDRERLISSPLIVTVTETERVVDMSEVEILTSVQKESMPSTEVTESEASKKSKSDLSDKRSKKGDKDKKGKDKKKGSDKGSKASKTASTPVTPQNQSIPIRLGVGKLDLLPLFLGYSFFSEALYIEHSPPTFDENATALQNLLKVKVNVSLEGPSISADTTTILHITVESLYNVPSMVTSDFQYELCCLIPGETLKLEPMTFNKGRVTNKNQKFKYKLWPRISEERVQISSTYRIPDDLSDVKNMVGIDLDPVVWGTSTRIEWNVIRRQFLSAGQLISLKYQIGKYRKIPIEIYITPPKEPVVPKSQDVKKKSPPAKGGKKDKGSRSKSSMTSPVQSPEVSTMGFDRTVDYLHIIALVDVGYLLYPGVTKCRVACPLRTYQEVEVLELAGLSDSFFRPKPPPPSPVEVIEVSKPDKKGAGKVKGGKASKAASSASSKSGKAKDKDGKKEKGAVVEGTNLAEFLPLPPPPPPPPSKQVLNDEGQPAFIILEFELFRPLAQKRELEALDEEMSKFLPKKPDLPKKFISSKVAEGIYSETIRVLLIDMNLQYRSYLEEKKHCRCDLNSFMAYLQQIGTYQTYLSSIIRSLSMMVPQKYGYKRSIFRSAHEYQTFVSNVYVDMVQEMNRVVNEYHICYANTGEHRYYIRSDKLLLYAKEALELGEEACAERYYLERICCREDDPDCWFDYAVFLMDIGKLELAKESVTEVVQLNTVHKYGLMMYGLILSDKDMHMESETCLLRMMFLNPSWSEGWIVLYSFYKRVGNLEGAEFCWDMARKWFENSEVGPRDYFNCTDDLAWPTDKLNDNVFLRTAALLIKMRLHEHAERVMSHSLFTQKGLVKYLRGVISYIRKDYRKSLEYLYKAEKLIGHCYIKLKDFQAALKQYTVVLGMFNRPEDVHLVFMNAAMAYDVTGDSQKARQLALKTCKLSPTPQSWLFAGGFYYKQNDLLSGEECLIQANLCDNRLADPWAYLALINFQLGRRHQCDLCLTQAKKFNVEDKSLVKDIEEMMRTQKKHYPD